MSRTPATIAFFVSGVTALCLGGAPVWAQAPAGAPAAAATPAAAESFAMSEAQLDQLVGPIALYPDDLVALILPASTYPIDVVKADRFLEAYKKNKDLKPDENWHASVRNLINTPDVIKKMSTDLDWTMALGEAVTADTGAVMDAVQRFRRKVYAAGNLKTDEKQVVVVEKEVIKVEPANPEVVYVPQYEPTTVVTVGYSYGYYPYGYPSYYYPYPPGYAFAAGVFWGAAIGAAWGGHWGADWHGGDINIDNDINIDRGDRNVDRGDRGQGDRGQGNRGQGNRGQGNRGQAGTKDGNRGGGKSTWQPNKAGNSQLGASNKARQGGAGARPGDAGYSPRVGNTGTAGAGNKAGSGGWNAGARTSDTAGAANRAGGSGGSHFASDQPRASSKSGGYSGRSSSAGSSSYGGSRGGSGSSYGGSRGGGGSMSGYGSSRSTSAASSRGASSRGGGGGGRGGGGRGGGRR